jgi:Arc/MetJ-type ribon-helix-helix transcriptional regulator
MPRHLDAAALPEDIARLAATLVAAGRFASIEDALRAGVKAMDELGENDLAANETAWAGYLSRRPADPRDLTAREAVACLNGDDPEKKRVLRAHLDAIFADMESGEGTSMNDAEFSSFLDDCIADAERRV